MEHYIPDTSSQYQEIRVRSAPRCYSRRAMSQTIRQSRMDVQSNTIVIVLSIVSGVAGFMLVSGGWTF